MFSKALALFSTVCIGALAFPEFAYAGSKLEAAAQIANILALLALIPLLLAVFRYRNVVENQRRSKIFAAWQTINSAQGQASSGGRVTALEELTEGGSKPEDLSDIDLSNARLQGISIPHAKLNRANLQDADVSWSNLRDTKLREAILCNAEITRSNLNNSKCPGANFQGANLGASSLNMAVLTGADFRGSTLWGTQMRGAQLMGADFQGADLLQTDLTDADLDGANFCGTNLLLITGLTQKMANSIVCDEETIFPKGIHPPETEK